MSFKEDGANVRFKKVNGFPYVLANVCKPHVATVTEMWLVPNWRAVSLKYTPDFLKSQYERHNVKQLSNFYTDYLLK
jgi:hypothetical protein